MENTDIYVLSSIVVTLFIVFIVGIFRAVKDVDEESYKHEKDGGPRVAMLKFVGRMFDDEKISKKEKKTIYKAMYRTISDMESDGVYFPDEVIEKLNNQKEELFCEYSGLPSPSAYVTNFNKKSEKNETPN